MNAGFLISVLISAGLFATPAGIDNPNSKPGTLSDPTTIISKMINVYLNLSSYQAIGESEEVRIGNTEHSRGKHEFSVVYKRPNRLKMEITAKGCNSVESFRFCADGRDVFVQNRRKSELIYKHFDDLYFAINLSDIETDNNIISKMLLDNEVLRMDIAYELASPRLLPEEVIDNVRCYVVATGWEGSYPEKTTLWIGQDDFLIRKLEHKYPPNNPLPSEAIINELSDIAKELPEMEEEIKDMIDTHGYKIVTTYKSITVNEKISDDTFKFTPAELAILKEIKTEASEAQPDKPVISKKE